MNAPSWRLCWALLLLPVLLAPAHPAPGDWEALVRAAGAAYRAGDLARAAALCEEAQRRATDPRLVAFNLATAKYQLARAGDLRALGDAEVAYRCCLGKGDARRAQALFGLGNCLVLRGSQGKLDGLALRMAIDRYTECLRDPGCDEALAADARYNQQRARLLLLQAPPSSAPAPDQEGGDEGKKDDPPDAGGPEDPRERGGQPERGSQRGDRARGSPDEKGLDPDEGKTGPGKSTLPPVADDDRPAPLAAQQALEHLEKARRRIVDDLVKHRRGRARPAAPGVRDW